MFVFNNSNGNDDNDNTSQHTAIRSWHFQNTQSTREHLQHAAYFLPVLEAYI